MHWGEGAGESVLEDAHLSKNMQLTLSLNKRRSLVEEGKMREAT